MAFKFKIDSLFKHKGKRIPNLAFDLESGLIFDGQRYCSKKNPHNETEVSYQIATGLAMIHNELCGCGETKELQFYAEVKDETGRYPVLVDVSKRVIFHKCDVDDEVCHHIIEALAALVAAHLHFDEFSKLFHMPSTFHRQDAFVKMCDALLHKIMSWKIEEWIIEQKNPSEMGINVSIAKDLIKDVLPHRQESEFAYVHSTVSQSKKSKKRCHICGAPLIGRQKKYCSFCKKEGKSVVFVSGPDSDRLAPFKIKVFGNPNRDIPKELRKYIPKQHKPLYLPEETRKLIETAVNLRKNINLIGEPGTGKTLTAYAIAYSAQLPLVSLSMSGGVQEDRFQGEKSLFQGTLGWHYAPAALVVKYGGVLHIDEWPFAPADVLALLHSLLDDRRVLELTQNNGEVIECHPNTIIILSQNPSNDPRFVGYQDANEALEDRLLPIHFDFLPEDLEVKMLLDETGYHDDQFVRQLVRMARRLRTMKKNNELRKVCTPRALRDVIHLVQFGIPVDLAIKTAIVNRLAVDESEADAVTQIAQVEVPACLQSLNHR